MPGRRPFRTAALHDIEERVGRGRPRAGQAAAPHRRGSPVRRARPGRGERRGPRRGDRAPDGAAGLGDHRSGRARRRRRGSRALDRARQDPQRRPSSRGARGPAPAARRAVRRPRRRRAPPLFGDVDRHWLGYHVRRLCRAAGVPVVCPHGLRGTQSSISALAVPVEHVAVALGQTGPAVTRRHYLAAGAGQDGRQRAALRVLSGGRR